MWLEFRRVLFRSLMKAQRASLTAERPSKEERASHKAEFFALISAENFDETKAQSLIELKQQKSQAKGVAMLKMQNEIYQLLTPEQKVKFKEKFENRHNKRGKGKASD